MMMLQNIAGQDILYFATSLYLLLLHSGNYNFFLFYKEYIEEHLLSFSDLKHPFMLLLLSV